MQEMRKLLAALTVYENTLRIVHWNSSGHHFDRMHKIANSYREKFGDFIDDVAEMLISLGGAPVSVMEACKILSEDSDTFIEINSKELLTFEDMVEALDKIGHQVYKLYDSLPELPSEIESLFDNHREWIRREIFYKNARRKRVN